MKKLHSTVALAALAATAHALAVVNNTGAKPDVVNEGKGSASSGSKTLKGEGKAKAGVTTLTNVANPRADAGKKLVIDAAKPQAATGSTAESRDRHGAAKGRDVDTSRHASSAGQRDGRRAS